MMDEVRVMFVLELECVWGDMTFDLLTLFGFSNVNECYISEYKY